MALTTGIIKEIPYVPALLPDGILVSSLAANAPQTLVSLPNLHQVSRIARLRRLRMPATAGIALTVTADSYSTPPVDAGAAMAAPTPAGLANDPWEVTAAANLLAQVTNGTGAPANNWWASWLVELDQPNAALRQQYPATYPTLSAADQAAAEVEQLSDPLVGGIAPRPLAWIIENEYRSHLRRSVVLGKTISMATGQPTLFVQEARSDPNEMLVLMGLITSPGTGSDQLSIIVGIDDHESLYTVSAYPLGQVGFVPMFLQAAHTIQIQATTQTAESVGIAANIWHVTLTDLIRYRLNQSVPAPVVRAAAAGTL